MGQLFALIFSASYGLSNVFASKAIGQQETDKYTGQYITLLVNSMINLLVLILYLFFGNRMEINANGLIFFGIAGFLNSFLSRGVFFASIPYIGVSRAGVLKITSPMFAIIGGILILGEALKGKVLIGAIVVFAGIIYISVDTLKENKMGGSVMEAANSFITMPRKGILLGLLAGLLLGIGSVFRKIGINYIPSSILGVCVGSIAAFFSILVFQIYRGQGKRLFSATKNMNKEYFISGIFSSLALYSVFLALKYIPVSLVNSIGASESLFTMLWSLIICGRKEIITLHTLFGAVVVITGVTILIVS